MNPVQNKIDEYSYTHIRNSVCDKINNGVDDIVSLLRNACYNEINLEQPFYVKPYFSTTARIVFFLIAGWTQCGEIPSSNWISILAFLNIDEFSRIAKKFITCRRLLTDINFLIKRKFKKSMNKELFSYQLNMFNLKIHNLRKFNFLNFKNI